MTTVHRTGILLVGRTYVKQFRVEPGDKLNIVVDEDCIRLVPAPIETQSTNSEACSVG